MSDDAILEDTLPDDEADDALTELRDRLLEEVMINVAFDGWTDRSLADAARMTDTDPALLAAAFPDGVEDVVLHLHDWADRQMLAALEAEGEAFHDLGMTERVEMAVMARLDALAPHKEAVRRGLVLVLSPRVGSRSSRAAMRTVDCIWRACGDTATDFNHYTKRLMLLSVLGKTLVCWLGDSSEDHAATRRFLHRRLVEVTHMGKLAGRAGALGRLAEAPWRAAAMVRRRVVGDA
ncbi:MAG: COQ9 family protein [Rhodospirillaceae bacterium]|nr:COQ9 family protein [Rhodospirillaceae bacterium]